MRMKPYKDQSGNSGILAYGVEDKKIIIAFKTGEIYTYSYDKAGKKHVEEMKKLAELGRGLTTYINKYVSDLYDK